MPSLAGSIRLTASRSPRILNFKAVCWHGLKMGIKWAAQDIPMLATGTCRSNLVKSNFGLRSDGSRAPPQVMAKPALLPPYARLMDPQLIYLLTSNLKPNRPQRVRLS